MLEQDHKGPSVTWVFRKPLSGYFSIEGVFEAIKPEVENSVNLSQWVAPLPGVGLWPRMKNLLAARKISSEIVHITGDAHYLAISIPRKKLVLTIHDCGFLYHPQPLVRRLLKLFWLTIPVARASAVTVISEATFLEVARATGAEKKLRLIPNPVNSEFVPSPLPGFENRARILQIGTKENKNVLRVAEALIGLDVTLVILGKPTEKQITFFEAKGIRYEWQTGLDTASVAALYRSCHLLLFASTYEGFGLPIIEAQASGRPVITSCIEPLQSVAGEGALLIDPYHAGQIRSAVVRLLEDNLLRNELILKGKENVKRFLASNIANAYIRLYKEVCKSVDNP